MEALFIYLGKMILCSGVMFLYYWLFLKDKTFHHYNRFYLLATLVISLLLPLLKINYFTLEVKSDIYLLINRLQNLNTEKSVNHDYVYYQYAAFVVGLVSVFFISRFSYGLIKIQQLKKQFPQDHFEGISFYQTNLQNAPFSFFKNLFWKDSILIQSDLGRQILKHEMVHIEQKHSFDKIAIELVTSIFWFNPIFKIIKKEISLIHEYLADKKAIQNADTKAFAQMLLASNFSGKPLPATSPFLSSNLKKRLTMLKKSKTKFGYARKILALPLLFAIAFIYLVNAKNKEIRETNAEITKTISTIKKDTVKTKSIDEIQSEIDENRMKLEPFNDQIRKKDDELRKIADQLTEKQEALNKISEKQQNSPEAQKLMKDMEVLGKKMNKISDSDEYKNLWKKLDEHYKQMDGLYAQLDQYYNSDEFKNQIANAELQAKKAEEMVNSPEFKKKIKDAEAKAAEAEKFVNSRKFKKQIKEAEKHAAEAEKFVNSAEFQAKIKEAAKNAEAAAKNAEAAAEKAAEAAMKAAERGKGYSSVLSTDPVVESNSENAKIFLNGVEISKEKMKTIPPDEIAMVNVLKKGYQGNSTSQIHITTKKK